MCAAAGCRIRPTWRPSPSRAQVIFLAEDSAENLEEMVLRIARHSAHAITFALVTPVPVGTASKLEQAIKGAKLKGTIVSQPMFFTDGCAVEDFNWPDRIILGTTSSEAVATLKQIFHPLVMRGVPVVVTNHETAELVREAATAFVATKISFINELSSLCERVNADAVSLSLALGLDKKIAPRCLQPGAGMGGSFAESDMDSLARLAQEKGVDLKILSAARDVNAALAERLVAKISGMVNSVENKEVGILGLAFKPNTNSVAGSSSIRLAQTLLAKGARVRAYDPEALAEAKMQLNGTVRYCETAYAAAEGVDALVVGTGMAGIPHARLLEDQASAEAARNCRHEKPARFVEAQGHGVSVHGRGADLARYRPTFRTPHPIWIIVVEKLLEPVTSHACPGSFDRVRLAPHFAQDDKSEERLKGGWCSLGGRFESVLERVRR